MLYENYPVSPWLSETYINFFLLVFVMFICVLTTFQASQDAKNPKTTLPI